MSIKYDETSVGLTVEQFISRLRFAANLTDRGCIHNMIHGLTNTPVSTLANDYYFRRAGRDAIRGYFAVDRCLVSVVEYAWTTLDGRKVLRVVGHRAEAIETRHSEPHYLRRMPVSNFPAIVHVFPVIASLSVICPDADAYGLLQAALSDVESFRYLILADRLEEIQDARGETLRNVLKATVLR